MGAQKLAVLDGIVIERNDRAYGRSCSGTFIWLVRARDGHRNAALQRAAHVVLDIVRELLRAVLGEMHPIAAAQPANLAFEIRALHCVLSLTINEAAIPAFSARFR